ncbi:MAG: polysaccharide biosynthesis/export family protein, partial [Candidatus Marinimicrobia bacterium]|nr:polysaccharide biosynthesis/export family protein [Candidatus Neomarinimicrobiota bacterium]
MKKEATTCNHQSLAIILMALAILILGTSVAFGATYRIEPGDKLLISVFGQSDYDQTVTVREDGKISYFGGDLSVAGKTPEEVNQLVYDRLSQQAHLKDPLIIVSPIPSEKEIFVSGAVNQPGRY